MDPDIAAGSETDSNLLETQLVQSSKPSRKRKLAVKTSGIWHLALIISAATGFWNVSIPGISELDSQRYPVSCVVGVALTQWAHILPPYQDNIAWLTKLEQSRCRTNIAYGMLSYPIHALARLSQPFPVTAEMSAKQIMQSVFNLQASEYSFADAYFLQGAHSLSQLVTAWSQRSWN